MDTATLHLIISTILMGLMSGVGYLIKMLFGKITDVETDLNIHKLNNASEFARLTTQSNDVYRRLESIENKLDRLLERENEK